MAKQTVRYDLPLHIPIPFGETLQRFSNVNTKDVDMVQENGEDKVPFPFVKWAGGKRSLLTELKNHLPPKFNNYYEPFVGGGALFFEIYQQPKKSFLTDINLDLIISYNVIKKNPEGLIAALRVHAAKHSEDYYYKIRTQHELQDPIEIAARFIYLNHTCYNGLYRVNRKGEFNVPIGSYTTPNIIQEKNILACSKALKSVTIEYRSFDAIAPEKDDLVYCDPPYHPTVDTSFTAYTKHDFTEKDQTRLSEFAIKCHKQGAKIMLSNSNTKFIRDLYKSSVFNIIVVNAPRLVNCKAGGRGSVEELLIRNY